MISAAAAQAREHGRPRFRDPRFQGDSNLFIIFMLLAYAKEPAPQGMFRRHVVRGDGVQMGRVERIVEAVCQEFGLTVEILKSDRRAKHVAQPRQAAMVLMIEHTNLSLPQIGRYFGGRDHTTVMHAQKAVAKRVQTDDAYATSLGRIVRGLKFMGAV